MTTRPTTDAIWSHLSSDLRQFIRRRVADDHVADDLLQESFMRVHRSLSSLGDSERLAAWVYQIARNVIHDHHRQASASPVALADADVAIDHEDCARKTGCAGAPWLVEMIKSLPDGYREAIQLAEIEGLTQQEVADRLGLSLSGAKSRVQRGRALLKTALDACCSFDVDGRGQVMTCDPKPNQKICRDC